MNSRKFAVASDSSTQRQPLDRRPCCTPLGSKHPDLVAVIAPMCIKGLRLVTVQLPEKFSPIRPGTNRSSPERASRKRNGRGLDSEKVEAAADLGTTSEGVRSRIKRGTLEVEGESG